MPTQFIPARYSMHCCLEEIIEIDESIKHYTPDFFIRSYAQNTASIIEIKNADAEDDLQDWKRNEIILRYVNALPTPVAYTSIRWDDRNISQEKLKKFYALMGNQHYEEKFYNLLKSTYKHNGDLPFSFPQKHSVKEYHDFLFQGVTHTTMEE